MSALSRQAASPRVLTVGRKLGLSMRNLNVCFIATPSLQLQIKHLMKTTATIQNPKTAPTLFQIAAQLDGSPTAAAVKPATSLNRTPLADLMLHPEKVETVLEVTKNVDPTRQATRASLQKKRDGGATGKLSRRPLVATGFHLEAPLAGSVQLAADFTDWEKSPIDLIKSDNGIWQAVVSLPPGDHPYRFLVDGEWCDDPCSLRLVPNPFGTVNAVVRVA
jgi:Glycogen recognition site of AMP-activated protein kinase